MTRREEGPCWHQMSRQLGFDECPPLARFISRRRWFNRQRRIYWLERSLGLAKYDSYPPFWRDDL